MGAGQVLGLTGGRASPEKTSTYVQAVPIYLSSDLAISNYLTEFNEELDSITGAEIVVLWSETVVTKDAKSIAGMLDKGSPRFPGLKVSDLPCLWIEDEFRRSAILKLPHSPDEIKQTFRILADAASETKDTPELVVSVKSRSAADMQERSQFLSSIREGVEMNKSKERVIAVICGVVFVAAILAVAIFISMPSPFQYTIFRIILALAAAGFVAMTPGFLTVEVGKGIRAGGALAVFIVVFFFAPAALPAPSDGGTSPASAPSAPNGK